MRSRPSQANTGGSLVPSKPLAPMTGAEQAQMASLGIRFEDGAYRFRDFRYDGLADAVSYAKREPPQDEI